MVNGPYSADWAGRAYIKPAQRYIRAALRTGFTEWTGVRSGDTTEVFLYPPGEVCSEAPIVFRFVGSGSDARVLSASSSCLDPS